MNKTTTTTDLSKFAHYVKILSKFVTVQLIVQAIGLVSGILLVRSLNARQYAFFTIANTMQGTMNILADSGISIGLTAIGGKVWQDRYRFGQLINTALELRRYFLILSILGVAPILYWLLLKQGASISLTFLMTMAVLIGLSSQLTTGVLDIIPRLHSEYNRLQNLSLVSTIVRAVLLLGAYFTYLNSVVAVSIGSLSFVVNNIYLRKWVPEHIEIDTPASKTDRKALLEIVKRQAPNSIFFCIQGQVTIWLISLFGNTKSIAAVGALGRLAVFFTIISAVMSNLVVPKFARSHSRKVLACIYWQVLGVFGLLSFVLMGLTVLFSAQILWILGPQYAHLRNELTLMMLSSLANAMLGIVWSLNAARAWTKYAWLYIPFTVLAQIMLLFVVNVHTTVGVILFGFLSVLPNILLNLWMSRHGFKTEELA